MSAELEQTLAHIFQKKGKSKLTEKDFVFAASLDLRWFSPKDAQKLLDIGLDSELLQRDGDQIAPTFDHKGVKIVSGFTPSPDILRTAVQPKGVFMKVVDEITTQKGVDKTVAISRINEVQDRMNVDIEVAALIVARSYGVDISAHLDTVEEAVAVSYKEK